MERISRKKLNFQHAYSVLASTWSFAIEKITIHSTANYRENTQQCSEKEKRRAREREKEREMHRVLSRGKWISIPENRSYFILNLKIKRYIFHRNITIKLPCLFFVTKMGKEGKRKREKKIFSQAWINESDLSRQVRALSLRMFRDGWKFPRENPSKTWQVILGLDNHIFHLQSKPLLSRLLSPWPLCHGTLSAGWFNSPTHTHTHNSKLERTKLGSLPAYSFQKLAPNLRGQLFNQFHSHSTPRNWEE